MITIFPNQTRKIRIRVENMETNYRVPSVKANVIWNAGGSLLYFGTQWLITVLLFRFMGAADAGVFQLCMTLSNVFITIALFGMRNYQISDVSGEYKASEYIGSRLVTVASTFIIFIIFVLLNDYDSYKKTCLIAYMVFRLSEAVVDVYHGMDQKFMKMDYVGISFALRGIISFAAFVLICRLTDNLFYSIIGIAAAAYLVIFLYDIPMCKKLSPVNICLDLKRIIPLLVTCIPLVGYTFFINGTVSIARYILEKEIGSEMFGYYTSVATPAVIVQTAATFIYAPFVTILSRDYFEKNYFAYVKTIKNVLMIIGIICIAAIAGSLLLGEWALTLILGEKIRDYIYFLMPIIYSTCAIAFSWFISTVLIVIRRFKSLIAITIAGFGICVFVTKPFIGMYGANGATYSIILAQLFMIVAYFIAVFADYKDCIRMKEGKK